MSSRWARLLGGLAALALALAGCGGSNDADGAAVTADSDAPAATFDQTTTVEIVRGAGGDEDFVPARIYERDAPGVVTIRSVLGDDPDETGVGSGFVLNGRGEVATNAHVVTEGEGRAIRKAQRSTSPSRMGTRCRHGSSATTQTPTSHC